MKKQLIICLVLFFIISLTSQNLYSQVRKPYLAGTWYPRDKEELEELLSNQFKAVELPQSEKKLIPFALISPHAGLRLSGGVAAHGYSLLSNGDYDTVILLGSSHNYNTGIISIYNGDAYRSPLGEVPIDKATASKLIAKNKNFVFDKKVHYRENSLETQIPYLQYTLDNFKIVPILTATQNLTLLDELANSISSVMEDGEKNFLIIASTDMSHYHTMEEAKTIDKQTIRLIENQQWEKLRQNIGRGKSELCGYFAVYTLAEVLKNFKITNGICLEYLTSGDVMPQSAARGVVGYSSWIFPQKRIKNNRSSSEAESKNKIYSQKDKEYLLKLARKSIKYYLKNGENLEVEPPAEKKLRAERAVFVTLNKRGNLRGCIGQLQARMPLYKAVSSMAVSAAFNDYRFQPLKQEELDKTNIEISVLTPLNEVEEISQIKMGKHGVYIKKGYKSGVFLPQVATDTGWNRKTFLEKLCSHKARLPRDAYLDKDTEVYTFRVIKFREK